MINVCTYVINLASRPEKKQWVISQLGSADFNMSLVQFIEAQPTPRNGAIGCAMSHAYALSQFLYHSDAPYCLMIEDDFQIKDIPTFQTELSKLIQAHQEWDVLLLASNVPIPVSPTRFENVFRVHNAQTTSAYVVTREYAPTLIKTFYENGERLSSGIFSMTLPLQRHFYAIDMAWKTLQISDRFWGFIPSLSLQKEGFSDIEQKNVAYGA